MPEGSGDHIRIGDAERRSCEAQLNDAVGRGLLTLAEYESRVGAVWSSSTRGELAAVVHDLPPAAVPAPAAARPPTRQGRALAVAAGTVVALAVGAAALTAGGSDVDGGGVGDRVVVVPAGATEFRVPSGVGTVEVIVPDGYRATTTDVRGVGNVVCRAACTREAPRTLRITSDGRVGDVIIQTREEHAAP